MNKSLSFVFFLLVATSAYSQTSSGNMMAGGAIRFQSRSDQSGSASDAASFTFSPSFGYFIGDGLAVGANLSVLFLRPWV